MSWVSAATADNTATPPPNSVATAAAVATVTRHRFFFGFMKPIPFTASEPFRGHGIIQNPKQQAQIGHYPDAKGLRIALISGVSQTHAVCSVKPGVDGVVKGLLQPLVVCGERVLVCLRLPLE